MQSRIITESELQSFNIYLQEEEKSKNTIEKYLRDVKNFIHFVGKSDITKETVIVSQTRALQPEEMIADDEKLSKCKDELKKLSAAKKVQTCDMLLAFLRENIEFIMLDATKFEKFKKQLSVFVKVLDSSTRLLFAQNMAATSTEDGNSLIELLFDVFEKELVSMLDLSDETRKLIEEN